MLQVLCIFDSPPLCPDLTWIAWDETWIGAFRFLDTASLHVIVLAPSSLGPDTNGSKPGNTLKGRWSKKRDKDPSDSLLVLPTA